jgi:hypothetical protein
MRSIKSIVIISPFRDLTTSMSISNFLDKNSIKAYHSNKMKYKLREVIENIQMERLIGGNNWRGK